MQTAACACASPRLVLICNLDITDHCVQTRTRLQITTPNEELLLAGKRVGFVLQDGAAVYVDTLVASLKTLQGQVAALQALPAAVKSLQDKLAAAEGEIEQLKKTGIKPVSDVDVAVIGDCTSGVAGSGVVSAKSQQVNPHRAHRNLPKTRTPIAPCHCLHHTRMGYCLYTVVEHGETRSR